MQKDTGIIIIIIMMMIRSGKRDHVIKFTLIAIHLIRTIILDPTLLGILTFIRVRLKLSTLLYILCLHLKFLRPSTIPINKPLVSHSVRPGGPR